MLRRTSMRAIAASAVASAFLPQKVSASARQTWLVVPSSAGGLADRVARAFAAAWTASGHGRMLVLNKPGAGGAIALTQLDRVAGTGPALFMGSTGTTVVLRMTEAGRRLRQPTPLAQLASVPGVLLAAPGMPRGLPAIQSHAAANPGDISFASAGVGSLGHLALEALCSVWNVDLQHVAYKSGPEAIPDLLTGRVHLAILNADDGARLMASTDVQPLAASEMSTGALAGVPTFANAGIGIADFENWLGIFFPPGNYEEHGMETAVMAVRQSGSFATTLTELGALSSSLTQDQFTQFVANQSSRLRQLVTVRNIQLG